VGINGHFESAVCAGVFVIGMLAGSAAGAEQASLPRISPALRDTPSSHAFSAAAHQHQPFDLAEHGYLEEEFLLSGDARVFDWPAAGEREPQVLAKGPYTTRILIRRPTHDSRFNGTAIVEAMNPSSGADVPIMWAESYEQLVADGYAWVGVTIKPNTIKALENFDPARYAAVSMPNPRPGASCSTEAINPLAQPTTTDDETGLVWDMLSQIGALLKSASADNPLGRPAQGLYMTGQSQTAGYARTYATVFGRWVTAADDEPLYDGYLSSGSPPWQVPLHQCRADLPPGDPRLITAAAGVPVIEIFAEGDLGTNIETRRADSDPLPDLYRRYEVAGAAHTDAWERLSFPSDADMTQATEQSEALPDVECMPDDVEPSDFPVRYAFNAAWSHLERWVRDGVPAPAAERLALKDDPTPFAPASAFVVDRLGNATGGLRTPVIDVPTARWVGAKTGGFQCMFEGYKRSFTRAELEALYGTREAYLERVRSSARALRAERWLTPTDAAEIVRLAERSEVLR
jgi:hypothetical protein